ncbi:MAG: DNA primase [Deinococcaceae bacterium]
MSKEAIRSKLNLAQLVGDYLRLQPVGAGRYRGLCPFHKEKTPSFFVDDARGYYYCFGCKAGGDIFSFMMGIEQVSFGIALERLASITGVPLERLAPERYQKDLYDINDLALHYFQSQMDESIYAYLEGRGIHRPTCGDFELGFAPASYEGLIRYASERNVKEDQLLAAGLIGQSAQGRYFDRFRGRIMFPIRDVLGRLAGFGGRLVSTETVPEAPKYINTPETPIFKKSDLLYGLHLSKPLLARDQEIIVVEGYLDVMAMHQAGFKHTVATLGTALTSDHSALLARQGLSRVALLFDRDLAGQKATLRALDQTVGTHLTVRALRLPEAKDPADLLQFGQIDAVEKALLQGVDEVELRLEWALSQYDVRTLSGKRDFLMALLPRMKGNEADLFDPTESIAARVRKLVAEKLAIDEGKLAQWVATRTRERFLSKSQVTGMLSGTAGEEIRERQLAQFLLDDPHLLEKLEGATPFRSPLVQQIVSLIKETGSREGVFDHFRGRPEEKEVLEILFGSERNDLLSESRDFWKKTQSKVSEHLHAIESRLSEDELRFELKNLKQQLIEAPTNRQTELLQKIGEYQRAIEAERRHRMGK